MRKRLLLACLCPLLPVAAWRELDLVLLPEEQYGSIGGRCLDGSMSGYYYGPPSSGNSSLWVFFMQGGGACMDKASCTETAKGNTGSSKAWASQSTGGSLILRQDPLQNPHFADAHHVFLRYCTGDVHSGQVTKPTEKQWGFYFSGHLNFKNIMQHILDTQPAAKSMERVLLSGSSAGGAGVYNNCDFMQTFLTKFNRTKAKVSCAPCAGWFFPGSTDDHEDSLAPPSYWIDWSVGKASPDYNMTNPLWKAHLPKECVASLAPTGEAWKCSLPHAQALYPHIQAPMYVIQNWFDTNQIGHLAQPKSIKKLFMTSQGKEYIAYYGRAMEHSKDVVTNHPYGKKGDGIFLASCLDHTGSINFKDQDVKVKGHNSYESLADWFYGRGKIPAMLIDDCQQQAPGLPCNPTCPNAPEASLEDPASDSISDMVV